MKRLLLIFLCLLVVFAAACNEAQPEPSRLTDGSVEFNAETLPKICATPYTKQMAVNMVAAVIGCDTQTAETLVTVCDTTDDCYEKLMKSHCDIVIAHDYGKDIADLLASTELGLIKTELDRDALVFQTNGSVNVESLTADELKSLYSGVVTDWKDVGGKESPVVLFGAKNRTAMHNAFQKYISDEITVTPVTRPIISSGETFTAEIGYDNRDGGLGYTLLSLSGNFAGGSIKPLAVDGIAPSRETVTSGQYPLTVSVNIVIRDSEKASSNAKLLYDWAISEQGTTAVGKLY